MARKKNASQITLLAHLKSIASAGGQARSKKLSDEAKRVIGMKGGKVGGKARAASLTSGQRSEIARKAAAARWGKKKPTQNKPGK